MDDFHDEQNDGANFARAIDCARFMPNLTTLSLYLQEDWEAELCPALRSTHNLVYLEVWVEFAGRPRTTYQPRPSLELPKLRNLVLSSQRWEQGLIHIKNGAPALESLILGREANDRALWGNRKDEWGEALGMASLRELRVLDKGLSKSIVRGTRAAIGRRSLCPELERVVLALPVSRVTVDHDEGSQLKRSWKRDPCQSIPRSTASLSARMTMNHFLRTVAQSRRNK